jgi:hypothetical protein
VPTNENRARERIDAQQTEFSQAYWDLPEKTYPELIRVPLKESIDLIVQGQRQEMAGLMPVKKSYVELLFDDIAGAYSEEEDPRSLFGPTKRSQSDYKSRVYVTHDAYSSQALSCRVVHYALL